MKKPRNKKYHPKPVQVDSLSWALAGAHRLPSESVDAAMAPSLAALALLKQGKASRMDWNMIAQMFNIGQALAAAGVGMNLTPFLAAGDDALESIAIRMIGGKTTACYAHELSTIAEALDMFQAQLRVCTQGEWGRALARVKQLHQSGAMRDVSKLYGKMVIEIAAKNVEQVLG